MLNNKLRMLSGVGAAAVLLLSMGCQSTKPADERSEGRTLDDKHIAEDVRNALEKEPVYKFDGVEVNTFAGIVQLSGFVNTDIQKIRAQEVAANVVGPRNVVNGIALKPTPMLMPTTSRASTEERIYSEPQPSVQEQPKQEQPNK